MPGHVTVACKVPNGLRLRLGKWNEVSRPVMGGGVRVEKEWQPTGDTILIKGPKRGHMIDDPRSPVSDGFALTHGVDADAMAQWLKDNADHDAVVNGLLCVAAKQEDLKAQTKDARDVKTGLEPLTTGPRPEDRDKRVPKNNVSKFDKEKE